MNIINKTTEVFFAFLICCLLLCGCDSSDDESKNFINVNLLEVCTVLEEKGVEILKDGKTISMGGREFISGVLLGTSYGDNENSFVKFNLQSKGFKNISFYLGSIHSEKVYFQNSEKISIFVDESLAFEKTVYNHDLPEFYTLNVENAESVSFKTESASVILMVGEITAWMEEVIISDDNSLEEMNSVKLMQDIVPYYKSGEDSLFCAYSKNGETVELGGNEYTDALRVFFPKIEKWSNDVFACFNLNGKYETFYFKAGVSIIDESTLENGLEHSTFATICIYADERLVFEENITTKEAQNYRVSINKCSKLTIVCKSIPDVPDLKVTLVSMFAEK